MSLPSVSNVFSDVYITGNCTVKGTISSLAGSITSQWTTSGSSIYYTTGSVGIGLTNPSSILNVNVTSSAANTFTTSTGTAASTFYVNTADSRRAFVGMDGTGLFAFSTGALALGTDNTPVIIAPSYGTGEKMRILTSGFVGIGTTNPGSLLTVSGGVGIGSGYNAFTAPTGGLIVQGNVGIGTSNPGVNALQVSGNVVTSGFTSNSTNTVFNFDTLTVPFVNATQVLASTNIGVGTTTPGYALDVSGDIRTTASLYYNTVRSYRTSVQTSSASAHYPNIDISGNAFAAKVTIHWNATPTAAAIAFYFINASGTDTGVSEYNVTYYRAGQYSTGSGNAYLAISNETGTGGVCEFTISKVTGRAHFQVTSTFCWPYVGATRSEGQGFTTGAPNRIVLYSIPAYTVNWWSVTENYYI
jgi:hypothetical protein